MQDSAISSVVRAEPMPKGMSVDGSSVLSDVSLPAAVIFDAPLQNNITWMQRFAEAHGAKLAPHGKTTMTPALFQRQLDAGAWGITLATAVQCTVAFAHGVTRLLLANQLIGEPNMRLVAGLIESGADFYCVVDSVPNTSALNAFFEERGLRLQVLIELGVPGGRCGVRTEAELEKLVEAVTNSSALALVGIEGYEGMISGASAADDVRAYGERLVHTVRMLAASGALATATPIVTASGSKWFDLIAEAFDETELRNSYTPLLRPGCYITHDHRLYREAMVDIKDRHPQLSGGLEPALAVFAQVQSLPEPGMAIVALGKRDISHDPDLPMPLRLYRPGTTPRAVDEWRVYDIMDQHTFMAIPADAEIAIGDIISFGASHPCLTFDKWRRMRRIDDQLQVLEEMPTFF